MSVHIRRRAMDGTRDDGCSSRDRDGRRAKRSWEDGTRDNTRKGGQYESIWERFRRRFRRHAGVLG